jgi:predicted permease
MVFTAGFAVGAAFGTGDQAGAGLGRRFKLFLTRNPPLWGAVLGAAVPAGWAPSPLPHISRIVVEVMLVMGFFAVGAYLSSERREEHAPLFQKPDRVVAISLASRFMVNPALLGLAALAGVGIPTAYLLQAAMPCGINGLIVGHAFGLDQRLIATSILWSTLLVVAVGVVVQLV